jgi:nickel superoxide dismutase
VKKELDILARLLQARAPREVPQPPRRLLKATKLASKNKTESDPANGEALMAAVEEIHNIYWGSKNRTDVPFYRAG